MASTHPISQPSGGDNKPKIPAAGKQPASAESKKYVESLSKQTGAGSGGSMTNAEASERVQELRENRDQHRPDDQSGVDSTSKPDAGAGKTAKH